MSDSPIDVKDYSDMRPYTDAELQAAMERMVQEPLLIKMMKWVYPGLRKTEIIQMFREIKSVRQFQEEISAPAVKVITQMTTSGVSFTNEAAIEPSSAYLFISNHRDIILDSALLNVSLIERGIPTTEIAIGDNLLKLQLVRDIVRCNKNFIVSRDVQAKEMFYYSLRMSNYIRHTITEKKTSIWIAQREGRSKDGDDRTATALLKMFTLSSDGPPEATLRELNLRPMCVSYEFDPCDLLKANELMQMKHFGKYEKKPGEDFHSMVTGLTGHKGKVNICVGKPMDAAYQSMSAVTNKNEKYRILSEAIDEEMHRIYHLWPNNYIAFDLLNGSREYKDRYSNIQRIAFVNYIRGHILKLALNRKKLGLPAENFNSTVREILLQMYANPVINKRKLEPLAPITPTMSEHGA
ncbi:MAG: 1-acyl-sn-glycerol-3-phosphate acyltransferase [Flavobacteriales bacterium]